MQTSFAGPKFAVIDKKTETGHQTSPFKAPANKDYTSLLNISTKFNGLGGSNSCFLSHIKILLDTSSLAIKKQKEQTKPKKTGVYWASK